MVCAELVEKATQIFAEHKERKARKKEWVSEWEIEKICAA